MFFELSKFDAVKALEIYKRAGQQAESLSNFYDFCKHLDLARNFQFPTLRLPPPSFLSTMEDYIREAPHFGSILNKNIEYEEKNLLTYKEEEDQPSPLTENSEAKAEEEKEEPLKAEESPLLDVVGAQPETIADLLGLDVINPVAAEIEQSNALALAIIQPGDNSKSTTATDPFIGGSGWELALVTAPSNNASHVVESKLAGGFDKLLLDSLYEDASRRQQIAGGTYTGSLSSNQFESRDPFSISSSIAPPPNVQIAAMAQQQQQYYQQQQHLYYQQHQTSQYYTQHQQMMMVPYGQQTQNLPQQVGLTNPFGDPYGAAPYSQGASAQGNASLL